MRFSLKTNISVTLTTDMNVAAGIIIVCNVDHDNKVTATDARSILRAAVGLEELK